VSLIGLIVLGFGLVYSVWVLIHRFLGDYAPQGWTSTFVSILVVGGLTLFSIGVIAQYIRAATNMSLGKPLYVVVRDPAATFSQGEALPALPEASDPSPRTDS
jgi:hypothetical protein